MSGNASPSSPCKDTWECPRNLFTKKLISKGYGFYCPQDGSVCKVKVISDEAKIVKDVADDLIKEIIIGDVDDPTERLLEACVRSMKNEEIAIFKFPDPLNPRKISDKLFNSKSRDNLPDSSLATSPVDSDTSAEALEYQDADTKNCASDDASQKDDSNKEKESEKMDFSAENHCDTTKDLVVSPTDEQNSDGNVQNCSPEEPKTLLDNELFDGASVEMYEVELQLISYTREPEIWEMSITEKWRRANYHKQKGMMLYAQGSYEWAFRRFGLSLKYIISLEHDLPSGQEEGMNIRDLKLSCYLNLAACQARHHNYLSIIKNCTKALDLQAENSKALFRRGAAYVQIQEYEKAKEDLDKAQEMEPKNQAIAKQQQLLKARVHKLNKYYANAMKKMFS